MHNITNPPSRAWSPHFLFSFRVEKVRIRVPYRNAARRSFSSLVSLLRVSQREDTTICHRRAQECKLTRCDLPSLYNFLNFIFPLFCSLSFPPSGSHLARTVNFRNKIEGTGTRDVEEGCARLPSPKIHYAAPVNLVHLSASLLYLH